MGLLTKNLKPVAEYQQWDPGDISNGDILGVYESLGGRGANSVTLESLTGVSVVRFNVSKKIYGYNDVTNSGSWLTYSTPHPRPLLIDEIQETKPSIDIASGSTRTWVASEITITDIEVVTNSGLRVTVT